MKMGGLVFKAIYTPGHTPGGLCWYCEEEKILFSGDTLFSGSIGRTDNIYGDYDSLMAGIHGKLLSTNLSRMIFSRREHEEQAVHGNRGRRRP